MLVFEKKLREIINVHSLENESDTPDFILAEYMLDCFELPNGDTFKATHWMSKPEPFS
jgi:hypothetical protein